MTDETRPLMFTWMGDGFTPKNAFWAKRADEQYVVGQDYRLAPIEERSPQSHSHYFAVINEAWKNLPDEKVARWPSPEHLRKWCLIKAGFRTERSIVASSLAEAAKIMAFVQPMDDYAVVVARENVVIVYEAESQSLRAMKKQRFQESKERVFDVLAQIAGVSADELRQNVEVT